MSGLDPTLEPKREIHRIEVITGAGGRRRWRVEDKCRILAETLVPGAVVSEVARRHGLRPQQLFGWRREARKQTAARNPVPAFVPAVVEPAAPKRRRRHSSSAGPAIELEIGGVTVRIGDGARPATVTAVIRALKGTA